jgi:hypothetical protein
LRCYLATGESAIVALNGCSGSASLQRGAVVAYGAPVENSGDGYVEIRLELDRGFVMRRTAHEDRAQ